MYIYILYITLYYIILYYIIYMFCIYNIHNINIHKYILNIDINILILVFALIRFDINIHIF